MRHPWRTPCGRTACLPICFRRICQGRQTASASSGRLASGTSRVPSPPFPPALRHCAFRPQTAGAKGLRLRCGLRRAEIHRRQTVSASSDRLALCPLLAWLPFVTACVGALAGSVIAQPAAPLHCAGFGAHHPWRAPFGRTACVQIRSRRICPTPNCRGLL